MLLKRNCNKNETKSAFVKNNCNKCVKNVISCNIKGE